MKYCMDILEYLQGVGVHGGSHSFDVLLAVYDTTMQRRTPKCNEVVVSYNDVLTWINNHGRNISTVAYQARKTELTEMGIITKHRRKKGSGEDIKLSEKGLKIAEIMKKFIDEVAQVYTEEQAISNAPSAALFL